MKKKIFGDFFFSEIALKLSKSRYFFNIFRNCSFLNQTLGLRKSFLNQTTYVLKNRLHQQSFLNRDSFLNQAFLNRDSTLSKKDNCLLCVKCCYSMKDQK